MTKDAKKGFVLYYDYRQHLALLNDSERGQLLTALLDYGERGCEPDLEGAVLMAFSFIRAQMDRDAQKYEEICRKRREAGRRGGRPSESNGNNKKQEEANKANAFQENQNEAEKPETETDTDKDTGTDTDKETETETDISTPAADPTPYTAIVLLYHEICTSFSRLRSVGDKRKKAIAARWKEYGHDLDTFRELFSMAEESDFLKGKNSKNWTADFDWLLNSANMAKVLEGKYNDKTKGGDHSGKPGGHLDQREHTATDEATLTGFHMAE